MKINLIKKPKQNPQVISYQTRENGSNMTPYVDSLFIKWPCFRNVEPKLSWRNVIISNLRSLYEGSLFLKGTLLLFWTGLTQPRRVCYYGLLWKQILTPGPACCTVQLGICEGSSALTPSGVLLSTRKSRAGQTWTFPAVSGSSWDHKI